MLAKSAELASPTGGGGPHGLGTGKSSGLFDVAIGAVLLCAALYACQKRKQGTRYGDHTPLKPSAGAADDATE